MSKSAKISTPLRADSIRALASWFKRRQRVLPWREDPSLYRVWISEIMLQQTQVAAVVPYFERFIRTFPTVESLAQASESEVLKLWEGLGYYARARNLKRAAELIRHSGFPNTREGWLALPGVGPYTAGAVLSISLNQPEAILDGNVERVLSRFACVSRHTGESQYKVALWNFSRAWVKKGKRIGVRPRILNQALMELGALVCTPKSPKCEVCPLVQTCGAYKSDAVEKFPEKKQPKKWIQIYEKLYAVYDREGRVALKLRLKGEWRAGLWDLVTEKPGRGFKKIGAVETQHVVTRHKISRKTEIWQGSVKIQVGHYEDPRSVQVPMGSALTKTLRAIRERFPEVERSSEEPASASSH